MEKIEAIASFFAKQGGFFFFYGLQCAIPRQPNEAKICPVLRAAHFECKNKWLMKKDGLFHTTTPFETNRLKDLGFKCQN